MKPLAAKELIKSCKERGWVQVGDRLLTPEQAKASNITNEKVIKKRSESPRFTMVQDPFVMLVKQQLGIILVTEFRFDEKRKWRFDYANKEFMIAIEQEGGAFTNGRHTRGQGFINDMEKYNAATLQGWMLIRRTPNQMLSEQTIDLIKKALVRR